MLLVLGWLVAAVSRPVQGAAFTNATPIIFPAGAPASPYPSTISVSQITGAVVNVSVSLNDVSHVFPDDLDVLLVGPGGKVMLMSDAGGGNSVSGVDLTFSQSSSASLPDSGPIIGGSYEPTDFQIGDVFPAPAPAGPYGTDLTVFNGTNPNGTWQLFAYDDATFNGGGSMGGGWRLVLDVATPPVITTHPQSQTVAPGSTVSFSVIVTGTPPFGFQWLRNGRVLVPFGKGTPSLTITNVQAANAGTYSVVISNSANAAGVTSSNAVLNVLGPLTLVESPQSQTVGPGATVTFRVTAAGTPPLFYQWRLNGGLLPGKTNSFLMFNNVQAGSGGDFSVTVWNDNDVFTTGPALLLVRDSAGPQAADDFADRPRLAGVELRGVLQGNSSMATSERGDPILPGGGKSVWCEWIAPSNGVVSVNLRGSSFDTLLSVFTGTTLSNLALVTKDDDQGGFYTSALKFNAQRGTAYQWMIDGLGFSGAGGEYTLSWLLTPTSLKVPVIVTNPEPQGVKQGSDATFFIVTESRDDHYQWLFNDVPIGGATGSVHTVFDASSANVGFYSVLVSNQNGSVLRSPSVPLQTGSGLDQFTFDKLEQVDLRPTQGVITIGLGESGWNEFSSQANGGSGDPNPCTKPFLKTLFQKVHAEDTGVIQIDTVGSEVFLLLGVYQGVPTGITNLDVLVACDVVNGPTNQPCVTQFNATQGSNYTAVVSALQGNGTETIQITATMGIAPPINGWPQCLPVMNGGSLMLQVPTNNWAPPPTVQWRFNGQAIPGANNTTLAISNFNVSMAGTYSVVLSNFVAATTNTVAHVAQSGPPLLRGGLSPGGVSPDFVVQASADQPFVLQTSTDLGGPWTAVATNPDPCFALSFTNLNVLLDANRYFRAMHWSPPGP